MTECPQTTSSFLPATSSEHPPQPPIVYGELSILGYNGYIPNFERNRRRNRSKFLLCKRPTANGIKKSRHYIVKQQPQTTNAIQDKDLHSISYTFSGSQTIIVEYRQDANTDMFQIGRSSEDPIDFVVMDTVATNMATQSTISRFACRILVDRHPPYTARIYAAGFDSSKNIFLGEKATKWEQNNTIDGLTTNGVLLMHPIDKTISIDTITNTGDILEKSGSNKQVCSMLDETKKSYRNSEQRGLDLRTSKKDEDILGHVEKMDIDTYQCKSRGVWREVSVDGGIYAIRESRSAAQKGIRIETESNILQDGTLIDLCGATLLWRSVDGFKASPTKESLEEKIDTLNATRPQCPVGLNTLVIPRKPIIPSNNYYIRTSKGWSNMEYNGKSSHQPYVYLRCGHVQGYHDWGTTDKLNQRTCPICMDVGTVAKLSMGLEPSFYVDSGPLTHVFNPCGHMTTERTVKYWSSIRIPYGTHFFHSICPFCATPLATHEPSSTKLIFQDDLD